MTLPLRVIAITVSLVAFRMASITMVLGQMGKHPGGHLPPRLANSTAPAARITAVVVLGEVRHGGVTASEHGPSSPMHTSRPCSMPTCNGHGGVRSES